MRTVAPYPDEQHAVRLSRSNSRSLGIAKIGIAACAIVAVLAIFTRVMCEPFRHDENINFADAMLLGRFTLYKDLSYAHLPNLPLLIHGFVKLFDFEYKFVAARFLTFACWMVFLSALTLLAWRISRDRIVTALALVLVMTNYLFVEYSAMLVAAHLYPISFAMLGLLLFLYAVEGRNHRFLLMFLSGLSLSCAAGFKANYVAVIPPLAIAAFFVPKDLDFKRRIVGIVVPLAIGGLIGALPTFYYAITQPQAFWFDVLGYFLGPHRTYWGEAENSVGILGLTLPSRLIYGYRLWTSGSNIIVILLIAWCLIDLAIERGWGEVGKRFTDWLLLVTLATSLAGMLSSLLIKPSFPQYFMPPVPFAVLFLVCLMSRGTGRPSMSRRPLLLGAIVAAGVVGGPLIVQDLPKLLSPAKWTGFKIHEASMRLRAQVPENALIATLTPVYPVEGNLRIYPELASGPFYYRIGDYLSEEERNRYGITSPETIDALLDRDPPDAILVGFEGNLDQPLIRYAQQHGFRAVEGIGADRYGSSMLYVR